MTQEQIKDELIIRYEAQIENYKKLSQVNDNIIAKQKEYINKLQELLGESKMIIEKSLSLIKQK